MVGPCLICSCVLRAGYPAWGSGRSWPWSRGGGKAINGWDHAGRHSIDWEEQWHTRKRCSCLRVRIWEMSIWWPHTVMRLIHRPCEIPSRCRPALLSVVWVFGKSLPLCFFHINTRLLVIMQKSFWSITRLTWLERKVPRSGWGCG